MTLLPSSRWPAPPGRLQQKTTIVQIVVVGATTGAEAHAATLHPKQEVKWMFAVGGFSILTEQP